VPAAVRDAVLEGEIEGGAAAPDWPREFGPASRFAILPFFDFSCLAGSHLPHPGNRTGKWMLTLHISSV